ncbi:cAMP-responsive element modulator isoform X1 [Strongylocentrotus purpuratus]|uniref:cAMP-responsive element modulator n=1 Tax=Strongylocentrotus purpuratus TaxID=7668 RepID=A0A7M7GGA4_STRPU|nr:cAMP-responsive element modulator isoform X1 [Strongylocentrotus purpuratus]|eukprot:XP_003725402.1 PREDICTED: cAMP-responsive element modulator isoform X1 [Strongylocentrotus purpuratus]
MDVGEDGKAQEENGGQVNNISPMPVSLLMTPPNNTTPLNQVVHVQSVIQTNNQHSVIQATPVVQVQQLDEDSLTVDGEVERKKRQEILSRRPSYRRILNDLSSDVPGVPKIEEEPPGSDESEGTQSIIVSGGTAIQNLPTGAATIQIANPGLDGVQGIQTLTMTSAGGSGIVQSIQTQDGQQFFVPASTGEYPVNIARLGEVQAYQIRPATSLPQGVVMAAPSGLQQQHVMVEEAGRKRELRLMKNREAAKECRRKKKEYIKCLENRVAVLENQNKTLIEELKSLKELYCHKSD